MEKLIEEMKANQQRFNQLIGESKKDLFEGIFLISVFQLIAIYFMLK